MRTTTFSFIDHVPASVREFPKRRAAEIAGLAALASVACLTLALLTWSVSDPSLNHATNAHIHNLLGAYGAIAADLVMQFIGLASAVLLIPPAFWGWSLLTARRLERPRLKVGLYFGGVIAMAALASLLPAPGSWPLPTGLGGVVGDAILAIPRRLLPTSPWATIALGCALAATAILGLAAASGVGAGNSSAEEAPDDAPGRARARALARFDDEVDEDGPSIGIVSIGAVIHALLTAKATLKRMVSRGAKAKREATPILRAPPPAPSPAPWSGVRDADDISTIAAAFAPRAQGSAPAPSAGAALVAPPLLGRATGMRAPVEIGGARPRGEWIMPSITMLTEPKKSVGAKISQDALEQNARLLEGRPRRFRREG